MQAFMDRNIKVAFIQDALPFWGGAEKVLAAALEVFPQAEVYTLVYQEDNFRGSIIARQPVHASFIDRLPAARRHHRVFLPFMPFAIEHFDLHSYDILVSFSYAVAHGVVPQPGQLHISYMHTPLRYAWQDHEDWTGGRRSRQNFLLKAYLQFFRRWDVSSSRRTDHFISVSHFIARRVWQAYHRRSDVLYPPVEVDRFRPLFPRSTDYLVVSRLVAHKQLDVAVQAFTRLGLPLVVVGAGPEEKRLRRMAGPSVCFLGWQSQERLAELYGRAKAFIHPGVEDFGIAMVEAQAAGCPVIALQAGAASETICQDETGLLYPDPTIEGLQNAVLRFEREHAAFDPWAIQEHARQFGKDRFQSELAKMVEQDWDRRQRAGRGLGAITPIHLSALVEEPLADTDQEGMHGG
jgi:glycosyltransferase involved in cell wall biosynthesis